MSQMDEISVKIDDIDNKYDIDDDEPDEPHNGQPITKIEVSPNEKYLVTYSEEDDSFVVWDVENNDESQLKPINSLQVCDKGITQICVSDEIKFVYICGFAGNRQISKHYHNHRDLKD
jgi:WD40 repeat protein